MGGCIGQRLRLALAQIEMELRAEQSLSILLDSLLQGVCIKSVLAGCSPVTSLQLSPYVFFSQKPSSLFMTNERQPSVLLLSVLRLKVKSSIRFV